MNVLDRRSSGAKEDRCKIGALCWCKSSHQIYPIETLAALCAVPGCLHSLNKSGGIDSHFLKMLGQAWKLYTIHAPIAQLVEQWTFNPRVVRSSRTGGTNSNLLL